MGPQHFMRPQLMGHDSVVVKLLAAGAQVNLARLVDAKLRGLREELQEMSRKEELALLALLEELSTMKECYAHAML